MDLPVVYTHFLGQKIVQKWLRRSLCTEITFVGLFDTKPLFLGHIRNLSEEPLAIMEQVDVSKNLPRGEPRGFGQHIPDLG